jgi:hypothetical protein
MSYSRVLTLGGETFGELIALRMEMSPIVARHDKKRPCNESTRTLAVSINLKSNIQVSVSAGSSYTLGYGGPKNAHGLPSLPRSNSKPYIDFFGPPMAAETFLRRRFASTTPTSVKPTNRACP